MYRRANGCLGTEDGHECWTPLDNILDDGQEPGMVYGTIMNIKDIERTHEIPESLEIEDPNPMHAPQSEWNEDTTEPDKFSTIILRPWCFCRWADSRKCGMMYGIFYVNDSPFQPGFKERRRKGTKRKGWKSAKRSCT